MEKEKLIKKISDSEVKIMPCLGNAKSWGNDGLVSLSKKKDGAFYVEGAYDGPDKLWAVNFERKAWNSFQQLCKELLNGPICKTWLSFLSKGAEGVPFEELISDL